VLAWFRARGVAEIDELEAAPEDVFFRLPVEIRPLRVAP
jgi:hypothetical protein